MSLQSAQPSPAGAARRLRRAARVGGLVSVAAAAVFMGLPLCPFALVTRHPCPGCGLTRATLAALHGHFADALHIHPLVLVLGPLVILASFVSAVSYVRDGRTTSVERLRGPWATRAMIFLGFVTIALWIARFLGAFGGPVSVA